MDADQINNEISNTDNAIREYSEFYDRMKNIYDETLRNAKTCTEQLYNGICDNYEGGNSEIFAKSFGLDKDIYKMQTLLSNLLDRIYDKIVSLNNQLSQLQTDLANLENQE